MNTSLSISVYINDFSSQDPFSWLADFRPGAKPLQGKLSLIIDLIMTPIDKDHRQWLAFSPSASIHRHINWLRF